MKKVFLFLFISFSLSCESEHIISEKCYCEFVKSEKVVESTYIDGEDPQTVTLSNEELDRQEDPDPDCNTEKPDSTGTSFDSEWEEPEPGTRVLTETWTYYGYDCKTIND